MRRRARRLTVTRVGLAAVEPLEGRALCSGTTPALPLSPGNASGPTAALTTLTPTLTWSAATGVNGYQVRVVDRTDGVTAVVANVGPTTTQYAVPAGKLLPGRFFVWTVRDVIGKLPGSVHRSLYFGTPVPPAPVAVASPTLVLNTVRPTLSWGAVPNANGYVVHVYDLAAHTTTTHNVSASATSYTFPAGGVRPGGRYAWDVRTLIGTVVARAVSATLHFVVPTLPAPTTVGPGSTAAVLASVLDTFTPTFSWPAVTSVGGFSGYLLTLRDQSNGQVTPVSLPATATSYTLPAGQLVSRHRYVWNLRLVDGSVTSPNVGVPRYFIAPTAR